MQRQTTLLQDSARMLVSPLFLMLAFSLSCIEPMRFCTVVKEINLQYFRRRRSSAIMCLLFCAGLDAAIAQTFSIGDKSGEFGDQYSFEM